MKTAAARKPAPRLTRAARTETILHAARAVFAAKGYEHTAVAEIAARCGVVESAVFKYFPTKRALLLAVLERWYEEMFGDYARELAGIRSARARLYFLVERHLRSVRDWPLLCRLMFREVRSEADYRGSKLHALNRRYTQMLVDAVQDGARCGEFRADLPPRLVRDLIYGGIEHHAWEYIVSAAEDGAGARGRGWLEVTRLAGQIADLVCNGLAAPAPRKTGKRA